MADKYNNERGDGSLGQVENISVQFPLDESSYSGKIIHYS